MHLDMNQINQQYCLNKKRCGLWGLANNLQLYSNNDLSLSSGVWFVKFCDDFFIICALVLSYFWLISQ